MEATAIIRLALVVISDRLITILALLTSCGLACWAMWGMGWERVTILAIYVIFSYLTVRTKEKSNAQSRPENSE
jgi:hypothetical protein